MRLFIVIMASLVFLPSISADDKKAKSTTFDINKGFSSVVEKILPAVVSIQVTVENKSQGENSVMIPGLPPSGSRGGNGGNPLEELFKDFFDQMERPRKMQAVGSGFIIQSDNKKFAYVITNHHVVNDAKTITVFLEDKTEIPATLLASDQRNDIAVLKLDLGSIPPEKRNLPTVDWADSDQVKAGDWVIAIGNPFNFGGTVTTGVVSYKGRYVPSGMQQDFEYIQHSAQINVGSSGGALFDTEGNVIGINNAIITNTGGNIGIGFAIPSNVAKQTIEQLIKYGKTRRAHLGIKIQQMNKDMAESQGLVDPGVIVGSIVEGGPSEGKLEQGDIIVNYEGKNVTESHTLSRLVSSTEIGKVVTLKVIRDGKTIEVKIKVEEMPDVNKEDDHKEFKSGGNSSSTKVAGLEIAEIPAAIKESLKESNKTVNGVMILGVDQSKDAAELFKKGDIIEQANHKNLSKTKDFLDVVEKAKIDKRKNILLLISRDGKPAYFPLKIDSDEKSEEKKVDDKVNESLELKSENKDQPKEIEQKKEEKVEENKQEEKKPEENNSVPEKAEAKAENIEKKAPEKTEEEKKPEEEIQEVDELENSNVAKSNKNALESKSSSSFIDKIMSFFRKG